MSISKKYPRSYHFPFSQGTTSDDRISHDYWEDIHGKNLVVTEKLDGENNCLSKYGVFARSHVQPTVSKWTSSIREYWNLIKNDLGDLEIFCENLYAIHSIEYKKLPHHFHVFAVRDNDVWLSWEEVKFYASMIDLPTVPEINIQKAVDEKQFKDYILDIVKQNSAYDSYDIITHNPCSMEGVVVRNILSYHTDDFSKNLKKIVKRGHVKTDEHWTKNWKRAKLAHEYENY